MQTEELLAEIRSFCQANADPDLAARYSRYFTEGYDAYGVHQELSESQKRVWLEAHRDTLGLDGFMELGDALMENGKYEEGVYAIFFLRAYRDRFPSEVFERSGRWLEGGIRNWAHADVLCSELLKPLLKSGAIPLSRMAEWRESASKWKRRAVPVGMLGLLDGAADCAPLLEFLRPMMTDGERVVHQGLGWFLREAWKRRVEQVEPFLLEWKDSAPRLIYQYATEKMAPEARARFRRSARRGS